jgi:hypothetical protein
MYSAFIPLKNPHHMNRKYSEVTIENATKGTI